MKLDHVGIAVRSIEEALRTYQLRLGFAVTQIVFVEEQKVRVAILPSGESTLELLEPTAPDSPIQKFLEKRGEGVHHLCFRVDNIQEKVKELLAASMRLVSSASEVGAGNRKVAFLHPKSAHGVLIELVEG
jgi:methylmalonyl-CoA epimerase